MFSFEHNAPESPGNETDDGPPQPFPGGGDNFGLTPRPKVRTQRADPLLGLDLGGVTIVKLIGEGGMGRVYEARQEKPARTVAVKVIRAGITSEKTMRRFEREAEFLGKLQHPGIAQIHIVGTYASDLGDVPFYVLEFIPNAKPITNYVHEQGLSLTESLRLFQQVCEAVSHGHDRSIVHRDLKPGNILVDASGNPKVIDFGVARSTDSDLALEAMKTDTGQMIGTVQYMAPEQFGPNPDDLNSRTDVYALGVVLYELLSGVPPYSVSKRALHEASRVVCEEIPAPLRSVDKTIPWEVSAIAERCLQKDRRRRYHTAGELAADIGRFLAGKPVRAQPSSLISRYWHGAARRPISRRSAGLLLLSTALVSVVLFQVFTRWNRPTEPRSPQHASLGVTHDWTATGLRVSEGTCYRLTVSGSCDSGDGNAFGPEGTAPVELRTALGPPRGIGRKVIRENFERGHPTRMLLGKVTDASVVMAVGTGITFVAPASGELSFRINEPETSTPGSTGDLSVQLERIGQPEFVNPDGPTEIRARIGSTEYLLFRRDGLQWQRTTVLTETDGDYPTLLNGIAWWPRPDWKNALQSTVLKTRAFAWAADPNSPQPVVTTLPASTSGSAVIADGPEPGTPALKFTDPGEGPGEVACTISRASP